MSVPDYCDPIIGYRVWGVTSAGLLTGRHATEHWPPYAPMVGRCGAAGGWQKPDKSDHHLRRDEYVPAPAFRCQCGVHAYKTAALRDTYERDDSALWASPVTCWGRVALWGRVIEHEQGWRAEYAYPVDLETYDAKAAGRLRRRYGVPCVVEREPARSEPPSAVALALGGGYAFTVPVSFTWWGGQTLGSASGLPDGFIAPSEAPSQLWTPPPIVASPLKAPASKLSDAQCERWFYHLLKSKGQRG